MSDLRWRAEAVLHTSGRAQPSARSLKQDVTDVGVTAFAPKHTLQTSRQDEDKDEEEEEEKNGEITVA